MKSMKFHDSTATAMLHTKQLVARLKNYKPEEKAQPSFTTGLTKLLMVSRIVESMCDEKKVKLVPTDGEVRTCTLKDCKNAIKQIEYDLQLMQAHDKLPSLESIHLDSAYLYVHSCLRSLSDSPRIRASLDFINTFVK